MTYNTGGVIQALDYNTFATLTGGINEVYADSHPGATTVAAGADYGYGQTSTLASVSAGTPVTAAQWSNLFNVMKDCGTHQGTTTVPPLPASNPAVGNTILAIGSLSTLLTTLRTNRLNLAIGQSAQTSANSSGTSAPWTNSLVYTFSVNLGTWDQARYFFNAGGYIGLFGSYPGSGYPVSSDDYQWYNFLSQIGTIKVNAKDTTAGLSNQAAITQGFWNNSTGAALTTSYQEIYLRAYGGAGYYSASTVSLKARLAAAPGTNGIIQFEVTLTQADSSTPTDPKALSTTFAMSETHAAGTFAWPGTATITPGSFTLA
jgi:hypothetical protein